MLRDSLSLVRRILPTLLHLAAAAALLGCSGDPAPNGGTGGHTSTTSSGGDGGSSQGGGDAGAPPATEILAVLDLPRTAATEGLSGTVYDASTHTLLAISDIAPRLVPFTLTTDYQSVTPGEPIDLTGRPGSAWDGEALIRLGGELVAVTVETAPLIERFDPAGKYLGKIEVPALFAQQASNNKGLESLTLSPSGAYLFTGNESALTTDGSAATKTAGSTIRVLRRDLEASLDEQRAYRTDPLGAGTGGDMGVSDLVALSDTTLLVLERGFQSDLGNTVRLYAVDFAASGPGSADISATPSLDGGAPALPKTLVVDLGALPAGGVTHPGLQPNPLLDNYEALALGPELPDGRRVVLVTSDDNANPDQIPRILVLAIRLPW